MSLLDYFPKESIHWGDLALWRKLILVGCLASLFYLGGNGFQHLRIYTSNPSIPIPEKGEVYPVRVMHGSLKYVTVEELEQFRASENQGTLVGIPFVIAFLTLVTSRKYGRKDGD